jgi:hypothetical protein
VGSFLAGSGSGELGQFSSEDEDLVSLEISEVLSPLLSGEGLSDGALCELLGDAFLADGGSQFSGACSTSDLDHLPGELESADGDDLTLDVLSIDQDALVVEDVHDGGELALEGTVVDPSHAADLDELAVALNRTGSTISLVVKYIDY